MNSRVHYLAPLLRVADVERSVEFYSLLGFTTNNILRRDDGVAFFAGMHCHRGGAAEQTKDNYTATVMFSRAEEPVDAKEQGVALYMYSLDVKGLREKLLAAGGQASEIVPRFYMEQGEMEVRDPDGYTIFIGRNG